jgi:hypothetical protein
MPDVTFAFLCEDLRIEAGGQVTAVGIWGERIELSELPGLLRSFAIFLHVRNPERRPYVTRLRIEGPFAEGFGPIDSPGSLPSLDEADPTLSSVNLSIMLAPVPLARPGKIVVTFSIESEPPIEKRLELEVVKGPRTLVKRVPADLSPIG